VCCSILTFYCCVDCCCFHQLLSLLHGFSIRTWNGRAVGFSNSSFKRGNDDTMSNTFGNRSPRPDFDVNYESELTSFKTFVADCSRYCGLQLVRTRPSSSKPAASGSSSKTLMVLEQLPLLHHAPTRKSVQHALLQFAKTSVTPGDCLVASPSIFTESSDWCIG